MKAYQHAGSYILKMNLEEAKKLKYILMAMDNPANEAIKYEELAKWGYKIDHEFANNTWMALQQKCKVYVP